VDILKLTRFMNNAYQGKIRNKRLGTHEGQIVFCLEDLAERVRNNPTRSEVEQLAPSDGMQLSRLVSEEPEKKYLPIWGYLTSIAAERSPGPIMLPGRDFAGHELSSGVIVLDEGADHIGEGLKGGKIIIKGEAGNYLGQKMVGGGIVSGSCKDYAFRNMRGGWGVIQRNAGNHLGIGNDGGRLLVKGNTGDRAGWLMHGGRIKIRGNAGNYLGLLMSAGEITVLGHVGSRTGWRMKGGLISASEFGPETGAGSVGGKILGRNLRRVI
jgi:formylmethanofuran dehydrogenase subunit C